jgi:predicted Zn-dependent peptidase
MIRITTLGNGLRVVTDRMDGIETASVGLWVGAGARHEAADQTGIAHFLEHMAFKGTARRTARAIAEAIEDVGGYLNAYTSREVTAYYARVLAADVSLAIDVIADIVLNPLFDPRDVDTERHVILQEIGQVQDTPDDLIFDWLQEAAFPDQPMGRPILGPAERVGGFTRADLARFVATHYHPGAMILSAAGAVDHDAICRTAEAHLGALPRGPAPVAEPARFACNERREARDLEQVHLALAFAAPGWRDPDLYTAQVYATAMGGGMSSRLFQSLREERGLCYSVFAQASAHEDCGLISLYAGTGPEDAADLVALTIAELRRAGNDMAEAEVERAKAQIRAGLLMGQESAASRAERAARLLAIWGHVPSVAETRARIDAVGLAGVRAFATGLAAGAQVSMAICGPAQAAPDLAAVRRGLAA